MPQRARRNETRLTVDLASLGVACVERLNRPVLAEQVTREKPEHLRDFFMERVRHNRERSVQLLCASDSRY
ncbi:TPA: DNA polymerase III subunit theta [Klebsiella quasipneumoniae subsp. quasipneumoniae]|nr:DNA polymerase III subunit theta [Klebsiella quasipneumoniae subsp. quasipneumoniae]